MDPVWSGYNNSRSINQSVAPYGRIIHYPSDTDSDWIDKLLALQSDESESEYVNLETKQHTSVFENDLKLQSCGQGEHKENKTETLDIVEDFDCFYQAGISDNETKAKSERSESETDCQTYLNISESDSEDGADSNGVNIAFGADSAYLADQVMVILFTCITEFSTFIYFSTK